MLRGKRLGRVHVGPDPRDRGREGRALPAQDRQGLDEIEHAFPAVDPAMVEQPHRPAMGRRQPVGRPLREALSVDRAGHDREAGGVRAQALADLVHEGGAADQQGVGVSQHLAHGDPVGLAAGADPVAVAALDRDDAWHPELAGGQQHRPAGRVAVLRVQDVEGVLGVLLGDRVHHGGDVALEIARRLLAELLQADHPHTRHRRRRPAAVNAGAEGVAPVLRDHRHVVAGADQLAQQVLRVDAHARYGGKVAAAEEEDSHRAAPSRKPGEAPRGPLSRAGVPSRPGSSLTAIAAASPARRPEPDRGAGSRGGSRAPAGSSRRPGGSRGTARRRSACRS